MLPSQGPHSQILMMGESEWFFGGLKFWPKVIFLGSMKDAGIFLGREKKKQRDFFGLR